MSIYFELCVQVGETELEFAGHFIICPPSLRQAGATE